MEIIQSENRRPRIRKSNEIMFRSQIDRKHFKKIRLRQNENRFYSPEYMLKKERNKIWFDILSQVVYRLEYTLETLYLGLAIFDSISSRFYVSGQKLIVLALVCLDIAAKVRENKANVKDLVMYRTNFKLPNKQTILEIQKSVITLLDFKVDLVLPIDVIFLLLNHMKSTETQFQSDEEKKIEERIILEKIHMIERNYEFKKYSPIALACSVYVLVRLWLNRDDLWPVKLLFLTGIELSRLTDCIIMLESEFENMKRNYEDSKRIVSSETQDSK